MNTQRTEDPLTKKVEEQESIISSLLFWLVKEDLHKQLESSPYLRSASTIEIKFKWILLIKTRKYCKKKQECIKANLSIYVMVENSPTKKFHIKQLKYHLLLNA